MTPILWCQDTLATAMGAEAGRISVKVTTTDGLGFIGMEAGIAAYAGCLLRPVESAAVRL